MVGDPGERLWRESRRLFMVQRRLGGDVLKVTRVGDRFLGLQDHRRLNRGLLREDATVHRGSEFYGCWNRVEETNNLTRVENVSGLRQQKRLSNNILN